MRPWLFAAAQKKIEYVLQKAGSKGQLGIIGFLVRPGGRTGRIVCCWNESQQRPLRLAELGLCCGLHVL